MRKYYEAYDERYKAVHKKNLRWMGYESSPIVTEIIQKYGISMVSRGLSRVEAGHPGVRRLVQVTSGGFSWWL